jgi:hypothetical protein
VRESRVERTLILVQIFFRHVVFGKLAGANASFIGIVSLFDSSHDTGFECIPLFEQFADTLRIRTFDGREALGVLIR